VHDVEDAVRQACLLEQLGGVVRRRWIFLGRLQYEGVAAGDRRGPHPHRNHRREVERCDAGDDTERLADRVDVDTRRDLFAHATLQQVRDAAAELDHLEAARHLTHRVREHLAVLGRQELRDLLALRVEQLADREEELGAPGERQGAPRGRSGLRGLNGTVDLGDRGEVDGA